jgi:hypothetical protein
MARIYIYSTEIMSKLVKWWSFSENQERNKEGLSLASWVISFALLKLIGFMLALFTLSMSHGSM